MPTTQFTVVPAPVELSGTLVYQQHVLIALVINDGHKADARLMAAAPDLLEALSDLVAAVTSSRMILPAGVLARAVQAVQAATGDESWVAK